MAGINWPASLPAGYRNSMVESLLPNFKEDEAMRGPSRRRQVTTRMLESWSFELRLTNAEHLVFKDFLKITTKTGLLSFNWVHYLTGDVFEVRFALPLPKGIHLGQSGRSYKIVLNEV